MTRFGYLPILWLSLLIDSEAQLTSTDNRFNYCSYFLSRNMSQNVNRGRGRGGRGRGGRGRGGGAANMSHSQLLAALAALNTAPTQSAQGTDCCGKTFATANAYRQHRASVHGELMTRADGTQATIRSTPDEDRARTRADYISRTQGNNAVAGPSNQNFNRANQDSLRYTLAPPLWVTSASQRNLRTDTSLKSRAVLLADRDIYLHQCETFTLGNGAGNTANMTSVLEWKGQEFLGKEISVPFPVVEMIGLDIGVHGEFGSHGDFAMVFMTYPNGSLGLQSSNAVTGSRSSIRRTSLLAMRFSNNLSRHTILTGGGQFFVPADGPGSLIQGANHVNVVSGTSVLNPDAVLVTVTMNIVFAVSGDRQ